MITEALLSVLTALVTWVGSLMPDLTLPEGLSDALTTLGGYASQYWALGHVLPVQIMAVGMGFFVGCTAVALGIKLIRILASFLTAGGGSAA